MKSEYVIDEKSKKLIEKVLKKGDRAEIIPLKDGKLKILHVERHDAEKTN